MSEKMIWVRNRVTGVVIEIPEAHYNQIARQGAYMPCDAPKEEKQDEEPAECAPEGVEPEPKPAAQGKGKSGTGRRRKASDQE